MTKAWRDHRGGTMRDLLSIHEFRRARARRGARCPIIWLFGDGIAAHKRSLFLRAFHQIHEIAGGITVRVFPESNIEVGRCP